LKRIAKRPVFARLARESGSNLVEYAILFIAFMMLMFGITGFGHALYAYTFVSNVARDASRWAAVNGSTCNSDNSCNGAGVMNTGPVDAAAITAYVTSRTPLGIDPAQITVTSTWIPDNKPGSTVEVQVQYNFNFIFPLIRTSALPLTSTSETMVIH
jgi:Flp pilus assembly protein TadG